MTWRLTKTRIPRATRKTWRRNLPLWVGLVKRGGVHVCGVYVRVGDRALFLSRW